MSPLAATGISAPSSACRHAWEQRQLGEVAEIVGGGTPDSSNANYWGGNIDWYTPSEIGASRTVGTSARKITHEGLDHSSAHLLPAGSILFTSRASIGLMAFISRPSATNQGFQSLIPNASINPDFLYALGPYISRYARRHAAGSTFVEISGGALAKTPMRIPSLPEQRRIGEFFSTLDSLIAAAERQEALLRQKKQAYLQLMFPQEGETEPRLRFAGFSGEWQRRKLRELVSEGSIALKRGEVIPRQTGKYPVYSSSASEDGLFCTSDSFMFDQELVTWSIDGGGKPFYRQHHRFSVTNVCGYALILNPQTLTYRFLGLAMGRAWARAHFDYSSKAHPSVIEKIYILSIPSLPEQRCIGAFFSTLDNLIAAAEKRTKSLHTLKSSYLQRMFV
ncbi:MAG: restriction endonuclease subunit S [Bifidobacterium thermacidophilum]|jgi:type I restriction enzyme S subunit|uniref:restriction endonuclease subunit S n=1 Tax=Bifidobacterium thermacidophilum TaxID=246618 RepID=UPI002F356922